MTTNTNVFQRGETAILKISTYNAAGALANPGTTPTLTLLDTEGVAKLTDQVFTNVGVGLFEHVYSVPTDAAVGWWPWRAKVTDSSRITYEDYGFEVKV